MSKKTSKMIDNFLKLRNKLKNKRKKVLVEYKSLGTDSKKRKICGYAYIGENRIEIEKKSTAKEQLRFISHELIHLAFPDAKESEVLRAETIIACTLWNEGYRKVNLK